MMSVTTVVRRNRQKHVIGPRRRRRWDGWSGALQEARRRGGEGMIAGETGVVELPYEFNEITDRDADRGEQ